ncbi:tRNA uridine-5-carboxymethylaminomethyl(34) synthesis GTPase MnmE [Hippea maritima]|uniref:tRNA modification GTPase MnmE n=1 Tax=Hippea maritima (strain ATCC 700847 / DSM 10411 / MH2) TaxID=760142 RepID=F2LWU1_HIPMA|nr:tRNA uridine-5-carboxymethylaminomethyl(34) synthesis GTPase MnmE [Hippea maritima]AEA33069.1 tRNA modification GTPase mnmE [Hippea maritima DSM 10411]
MPQHDEDIIAAIATGYTEAAIGIIRVSGKGCLELLEKIFTKKPPYKANRLYYGHITDKQGKVLDEVLVSIFKAPHSYTGEDSFEINCHGGLVVLNSVLERVMEAGARLAQPGEFTKRAFLNGKLDLSQAEAVAKVISAKSKRAVDVAQRQLQGNFSSKLDEIREQILYLMAENEVRIDHPEEDLSDVSTEEKIRTISDIQNKLKQILRAAEFGNHLFEGVILALVGKPNVGKSSLLNLITGSERAIVTDIPGTTRDVVKEQFNINGVPFSILDTAGIRKTNDTVEKIGVKRSLKAIDEADIVLAIFDGSNDLTQEDKKLIERLKSSAKPIIAILNKTDLGIKINKDNLPFEHLLELSCKSGKGLDKLEKTLSNIALGGVDDSQIVSLNASQKQSLKKAIQMCEQLKNDIDNDIDPALIGVDFMALTDYLDEVIGKITNEDMLDVMFKKFCIGK